MKNKNNTSVLPNILKSYFPVILVVLAITARILAGPRTIDDSYITYRYARNILAGNGFVYNPGEAVLGTTTPVYTLLMTCVGFLMGGVNANFPAISLVLNSFADAVTCILLWKLGKQLGSEWAGVSCALVWAFAPYSVTFAIGGLETSFIIFFLTAAIYSHLNKWRKRTALFSILALLTRPDALILIGPLALHRFIKILQEKENINLLEPLIFFLPGIAWGLFATIHFGSPIPHSVTAKLAAYELDANASFIRLLQHYAIPFQEHHLFGNWAIRFGIILYPFLYLVGAKTTWSKNADSLPFIVYPFLYFLTFSISNPLIFRWYLSPPLPVYFLLILIGASQILRNIFMEKKEPGSTNWRVVAPIILLILFPLVSTLSAWEINPDHGLNRPAPKMAWYKLELLYQEAAKFIIPQMNTQQTIAAGDVGALGYFTNAQILDTVGLNSEVSLDYYPIDKSSYVTNYAIPTQLIIDQQPDWIVILEVYGRKTFIANEEFQKEYQLIKKLPNDIYGSDGMLIFQRKNT